MSDRRSIGGRGATPAMFVALSVCCCACPAPAGPLTLTFRGTATLPGSTTDQNGVAFTITGMSGICYDTGSAGTEFLAVMDSSNKLVRLSVSLNANGSIASATVLGGLSLGAAHDFEGIALTGPSRNSVLLSEEDTPAIHEFSLATGQLIRTIPAPPPFASRRANLGLESLALRTGATGSGELWTANEEALSIDGPISTQSSGTEVRILQYALSSWAPTPTSQRVLLTQPIHGTPISGSRSGLADLLALPDGRVLALERSLALSGLGFYQCRIYLLDFTGATDVSSFTDGLPGHSYQRVSKQLLWSGDVANMEGITLGPVLASGNRSLIGMVDDGDPISVNTVVAFELAGLPPCVPHPADFNGDGAVSPQDIFDVLAAFFAGDPAADFGHDGAVSPQDIFDFLAAFFTPCP